ADTPVAQRAFTLERITDFLVSKLYEEEYVRRGYFRFYNLEIDESPLQVPGLTAELRRLDDWEITDITGATTSLSTLHLPNAGAVCLVGADTGTEEGIPWWQGKWQEANGVVDALKYFKYALIDIDHSCLHCSPGWLNQVRRYGISRWGPP